MKFQKQLLYLFFGIVTFSCTSKKSNPNPDRIAPVADFSASQTNITTGGSINFTDLSTESPTSWSWTFQGGTPATSTVKNPTNIQYNTAGTYTVTLTATNADGNNTKTKTGYITVTVATPILTTNAISNITSNTATSGGNVTNQGSSAVTIKGICWNTSSNPTIANDTTINGNGLGSFISSLRGLAENTIYYVRSYATNSNGTVYGNELSFTTGQLPSITTTTPSNLTNFSASSGGNITNQGSSAITTRGICWSTSQNPSISNDTSINGNGTGSFTSNVFGLQFNTTYYLRAYATSSAGTAYGNQQSFTTTNIFNTCGTVTDIDGNVYNTITIGTQCWMVENLKVTRYRYGGSIPNVVPDGTWSTTSTPAYTIYGNSTSNNNTYGKLYNWDAVSSSSGLAPIGWHIPTKTECETLFDFLGGKNIAGGVMKATTTWCCGNTGGYNSSGFTALPGGMRQSTGTFSSIGSFSYFWSSTGINTNQAYNYGQYYGDSKIHFTTGFKNDGYSVRCIKD